MFSSMISRNIAVFCDLKKRKNSHFLFEDFLIFLLSLTHPKFKNRKLLQVTVKA